MATLLLVEHDNNQLNAVTKNAVSAARELGGEVTLLVAGENCRAVAEQAARIAGVAKVLLADDSAFKHQLAENVAALMLCPRGLQPSARRRQRKREKHPAARCGPRRRRANLRRDCSGRPRGLQTSGLCGQRNRHR